MIDWRALGKAIAVALSGLAVVLVSAVTLAVVGHFFGLPGIWGVVLAAYLGFAVPVFYRMYKDH